MARDDIYGDDDLLNQIYWELSHLEDEGPSAEELDQTHIQIYGLSNTLRLWMEIE